jgi:hypothetical protein
VHVLDDGICVTCQPHELVDGECVTCNPVEASRNFNPTEPREPHSGKWIGTGALVRAALKIGKSTLHLEHHGRDEHGDAHVSLHDEHGGSLHLTSGDLKTRSGKFRNFAITGPADLEEVGQRDWLVRHEGVAPAPPRTVVLAGLQKTHLGTEAEAGVENDPYEFDRQTLHLPAGGKGVDDPAELFARPGTEMTTAQLGNLADTLQSFAHTQNRIDTGHGTVTMHVVGREFTFDTGKRGERPIVLNRGELRNVDKALSAAFEAYDPDEGTPLPRSEKFKRVISTKNGDITITRQGPATDFWIESDTTAIRISPGAFHHFGYQLDAMLGADLGHLTRVG